MHEGQHSTQETNKTRGLIVSRRTASSSCQPWCRSDRPAPSIGITLLIASPILTYYSGSEPVCAPHINKPTLTTPHQRSSSFSSHSSMTEYNYSPEAYEQHLAKQASVAEWSAQSSKKRHEYTNPFVPTPEELAKKSKSTFYSNDGTPYTGPDRPPTPTMQEMMAKGYHVQPGPSRPPAVRSPTLIVPQVVPQGSYMLVPRWTGTGWVYEKVQPVASPQQVPNSSSSSMKRSKTRPSPSRSQTMPVGYAYPGSAQQQYYYQAQPASGNSAASGSTGYTNPSVFVTAAPPPKREGSKLKKKKEATAGEGSSFFGRIR